MEKQLKEPKNGSDYSGSHNNTPMSLKMNI